MSFCHIIYIKIIIFTEGEKLNFSNIQNKFLEINSFDKLLKLINEEYYYKVNNIKRKFKGTNANEFCFEEIKNEKYIYVIAYLLEFILTPDRSSTAFFNNQIMIKYGKNAKLFELLRTIINENNITNDLLAKYWLRLYTLESLFYKITNYQLSLNDQTAFYEIYIKILYEALKHSQFNTFFDGNLYRGTKMTNVEINQIKKGLNNQKITVLLGDLKLPFGYVYLKSFFSFSKKKEVAKAFMNKHKNNKKYSKVLLIITKGNREIDKYNASNVDLTKISYFPKEEEILFFSFSCFYISMIILCKSYYEFYLKYLV